MMDLGLELSVGIEKYSYGVVMVVVNDVNLTKAIRGLQAGIDPSHLMVKGLEAESHVTVRYGFTGSTKDIEAYLLKQPPVTMQFGKTFAFDPSENSDNASPICVAVSAPSLVHMNAELKRHGTWEPSDFNYRPHLTLAYVKPEFASEYVGKDLLRGEKIVVNEATINTADGTRTVVPLKGVEKDDGSEGGIEDVTDDNLDSSFQIFWDGPTIKKGGPGSGNFGHEGRPGEVGGSGDGGGSSETASGYEFISPNTKENLTFKEAFHQLNSSRQEEFKRLSETVDSKLGLSAVAHDAIGDWSDGAENSVFAEIRGNVNYDTLRYSTAIKGLAAEQKAAIPFKVAKDGPDSLYRVPMSGKLDEIRQKLDTAGIQFRTLVPHGDGVEVVVFDPGSKLGSTMSSFAKSEKVNIKLYRGHGEFLGGETRQDGANQFKSVIKTFEKAHPSLVYHPVHLKAASDLGLSITKSGPLTGDVHIDVPIGVKPKDKKKKVRELPLDLGFELVKGGEGSGNFGHAGRPGEVGGSASGGGGGPESSGGGGNNHIPRSDMKLTADQRAAETRFANKLEADPQAAMTEYRRLFGNVLSADSAKELSDDYQNDPAKYAAAAHEPASWLVKQMYAEDLAKPAGDKLNMVLFTAGGSGAGKTSSLNGVSALAGVVKNAQIIYDSTFSTTRGASDKIDRAVAAGKNVMVVYTYRDPVDAMINGVVPRAINSGRTVASSVHVENHILSRETIGQLVDKYKDNPKVVISVIDNTRGLGKAKLATVHELPKITDAYGLKTQISTALTGAYNAKKIPDRLYEHIRKARTAFTQGAGFGIAEAAV